MVNPKTIVKILEKEILEDLADCANKKYSYHMLQTLIEKRVENLIKDFGL